jgi:hypothetical protein
MRRRRAAAAVTLAAALAAAASGCGNQRQAPPDVTTPGPPLGTTQQAFPAAGLRFQAPAGWTITPGTAPLIVTITTGQATLAVYRYPRSEALPASKAQLGAALDALVAAAKTRDPTFQEIRRNTLQVDGKPAVQLRGTETVDGQPRVVRSTHVYADGGEVVVDAFAPASDFRRVDAQAFRGVLRSLAISKPSS